LRVCVSGCTSQGEAVEANHGFVCAQCYSNLRTALQTAPGVLQHLREVYVLRSPIQIEGTKPQKKDPPAPFNLDAWQLAEDIWQSLTDQYIPVSWNHLELYTQAKSKCQEIHSQFDTVVNRKEVIYLLPIIKLVRTASYRYPLEEKPRSTLLRCPECQQRTVYQPPQAYGDELEVKCHNCGFAIPPEKMEFYANLAERELDANL
jgi:ribosomal protein S27E